MRHSVKIEKLDGGFIVACEGPGYFGNYYDERIVTSIEEVVEVVTERLKDDDEADEDDDD